MTATSRRSPILDELGGPPIEVRHITAEDRQPAYLLAMELRCACGSLDRSGGPGGYALTPHRGTWRALRDVSEELVVHTVRRVERCFPGWSLPEGGDVFERVECFLLGSAR
jgi:hypothetical protein